jgi:hypothetical protein
MTYEAFGFFVLQRSIHGIYFGHPGYWNLHSSKHQLQGLPFIGSGFGDGGLGQYIDRIKKSTLIDLKNKCLHP